MKLENQTKILKEQKKYHRYLGDNGLRITKGRLKVFAAVMDAHGHFAPEELVKQCEENSQDVSRATIYRCLKELLEVGIIRETAFGEKHHHYEHIYDEKPHHHAKCIKCGSFTEFSDLGEDKIYHPILKKEGFQVIGHEMHFYGICKSCQ